VAPPTGKTLAFCVWMQEASFSCLDAGGFRSLSKKDDYLTTANENFPRKISISHIL
jgi:hypothetical protein